MRAVVRSQWSCRRHGWLVTSQPPLHVHFYMPMGAIGPASQLTTCSTWGSCLLLMLLVYTLSVRLEIGGGGHLALIHSQCVMDMYLVTFDP